MTPEEKEKFFTAIGYSESSYNFALPKQVGVRCLHKCLAWFTCWVILTWAKLMMLWVATEKMLSLV